MRVIRNSASFLVVCALLCNAAGCDNGSAEVVPLKFSARHFGGGNDKILKVSEFLGPKGAAPGNVKSGVYTVRGTYDLTTARKTEGGVIQFGFFGECRTEPNERTNVFVVPEGSRRGSFEVSMTVKKWVSGEGTPTLSFVVGHDALDGVRLEK
jgi:hypothetical protein